MDTWISLNSSTVGRDRIARLLQFSSRALWDILEKADVETSTVDQFKTLEYILGSFRKLLRFGKCLDVFYSSLKTIHYPDLTLRFTITFSKLSQSLFLFCDHLVWISRTGLFRNINSKKWLNLSMKYWLLSIIMNLIRDIYEISRIINLKSTSTKSTMTKNFLSTSLNPKTDINKLIFHISDSMRGHKDIVVDTLKNICDLFIPLTSLGYTKLSARTVGILGTCSSIAAIISLIQPDAKLLP